MYWLLVIIIILGGIYWRLRMVALKDLPKNHPQKGKVDRNIVGNRKLVMCAGDSITHGNMGGNYVEMLENWFPKDEYCFLNAGRNADLTYTLLRRLDPIIEYQPDYVTVLIGTNDIQASLNESKRKDYISYDKINADEFPTFDTFKQNYQTIIHRLKTETQAKVAVASLPVISEDLNHEANKKADIYSEFIKGISETENLTYLPVREQMKAVLQNTDAHKYKYEDAYLLMNISMIKHYILQQSWDKICTSHGNELTHDMLHFNSKGAEIIGKLVEKFIKQ